ncbi:cobalamin biosynthesis protein CobD [Sphingobium lactosutens]|uniref:adenosylcobinamide-phosphate synthase CbiB n=1 Tax=Sphingobium lactosutens TaxID=522773 RepID=UPI0015C0FE79|nr:adenosylcobinamide-phosphate synthase CbiB [Sphingobium lactosutens]NWK96412.1 cobalamin biosynthesis protein CobD [Sphingobium lactosutens]
MADPVALAALGLDAALGWPPSLYRRISHPVGLFARLIERCESRWNRPNLPFPIRRAWGVATVLFLIILTGGSCWLVQSLLLKSFGSPGWIALALLAWPALAQRSLHDHVRPVALALEAGDLPAARTAVGAIVGRDTQALDESGVARAAIESLAESYCDGVTAPFFWLLVCGLPGVWVYKAINTADSLIGHREERWRAFGWAAARTDDLLNLIPARLSGLLLCLAGGGGWRILRRDARNHASPNAGWPEAAMAGALGVRLAGPIAYDGVLHPKPWIGGEGRQAGARDIRRALATYRRACLLLWLIAVAAWLF